VSSEDFKIRTHSPAPLRAGEMSVAEMQHLIETSFSERGRASARAKAAQETEKGGKLRPLSQLELARKRLMESLPSLAALTGRRRVAPGVFAGSSPVKVAV